jgi:thioredoxin reductase (NADPH)
MPDYDVLIVGGGPGGISALLWCHSLNLRALLLERAPELGGQLLQMYHRVIDYPGLIAQNGRELRDRFEEHLRQLELEWRVGSRLEEIRLRDRHLICDGQSLSSRALILATGARKRRLGVPGEDEFEGRGVSFSATRDHQAFAGREVCVVGGGDTAFENSLLLARVCPRVTLIHRSSSFRARQSWVSEVFNHPRIKVLTNTTVKAIEGGSEVERLIVENTITGRRAVLPTQGLFIRIGMAPNTESFQGQLELDEAGFIKTDQRQRTSLELVYAVGDVCRPICLSVATAVGQGAIAAKDIAEMVKQEAHFAN